METLIRYKIAFLALTFSLGSLAKVGGVDYKRLKNDIYENERVSKKLKIEIKKLENNLGKKNSELVTTINKREKLFNSLQTSRNKLDALKGETVKKQKQLELSYQKYLVNALDQLDDLDGIIARKITLKKYKMTKRELDGLLKTIDSSTHNLNQLQVRFNEYQKNEESLSALMNALENKKAELAQKFTTISKNKNELNKKYKLLKKKREARKTKGKTASFPGLDFTSPLPDFSSLKKDRKGVLLKYRGQKPVLSSEKGKVVYSGQLSSYGNVIMIDHGNEVRTILLGELVSKVKKGDDVRRGEVIGYTDSLNKKNGELYFEIRKKNKAQKIYQLVKSKFRKNRRSL